MLAMAYFGADSPVFLTASALGVLTGGTLSSDGFFRVVGKFTELIKVSDKANKVFDKGVRALLGGVVSAITAQYAGLPEEGIVIAGGFGAGAASSFE